MIPADYNLTLYRGDSGRWQFKLWSDAAKTIPVDLTDATVLSMLRDRAVGGSFVTQLDCTIMLPNIIDMVLTSEQCALLPAKGVWDMQITYTTTGDVVTPLKGAVSVTQDVTYVETVAAAGNQKLAVVK